MQAHILLSIDDDDTLDHITAILNPLGHVIYAETVGSQALHKVQNTSVDVVILDLETPNVDGLEILRATTLKVPAIPVIVVAGQHAAKAAIDALRINTVTHIDKPIDPTILQLTLGRALEQRIMLSKMNTSLTGLNMAGLCGLLGVSVSMQEIHEQIRHSAPFKTTVLITGESGTGKDLVARSLHTLSPRSKNTFMAVNCSAIPRDLLESQFFGHEKGAFTGAESARQGVFEAANGGTLFLDEVGDLAPDAQAKLLRTLEERQITRIGSTTPIDINVRLIAATNTNLKRAVDEHRFRQDLYYRLNVLHIHLVPLRERSEDVPLLFRYFLDRFAQENNTIPKIVSPEALKILMYYNWPGNVRELKNITERLAITAKTDTLEVEDLPWDMQTFSPPKTAAQNGHVILQDVPLIEMEKKLIEHTLHQNNSNRVLTAKSLKISVRTLQRKLKEFQLAL